MATFETHGPISVALDLGVGAVVIEASDREDAVVDVQPTDPEQPSDVAAARQAQVDLANGTLVVKGVKGWRWKWGGHESIQVRIQVPTGSAIRGSTGVASLRGTGRLGECHVHSGVGEIMLEETGSVELKSGAGDVTVEAVGGRAEIKTAGAIRVGRIDGPAVIKNSNGDTWIGEINGDARVTAANGAISVGVAQAGIVAKSANGAVRLDEVSRGSVVAQSAFGTVEVGVRSGVAAWLDLETKFGHVRNDLEAAEPPGAGEEPVKVQAHTSMGDIAIRRTSASTTRGDLP